MLMNLGLGLLRSMGVRVNEFKMVDLGIAKEYGS